nr:hypothetical protein [Desulfobulbaceae bacterium]
MISQCPHCEKVLELSEAQQDKIKAALANLNSGTLKLGCPHCKEAIRLTKSGALATDDKKVQTQGEKVVSSSIAEAKAVGIEPPAYPDISWLVGGMYSEEEVVEDVLKVLILMPDGLGKDAVEKAFSELGYKPEFPESAEDAMTQMRFVPVAAVVLHSEFDGDLADSKFHKYMEGMPMSIRRSIYYVLVGGQFSTLYDLEALAHSANVVVNDSEIEHIDIILRKGMQDYNDLFGPYLEMLRMAAG